MTEKVVNGNFYLHNFLPDPERHVARPVETCRGGVATRHQPPRDTSLKHEKRARIEYFGASTDSVGISRILGHLEISELFSRHFLSSPILHQKEANSGHFRVACFGVV